MHDLDHRSVKRVDGAASASSPVVASERAIPDRHLRSEARHADAPAAAIAVQAAVEEKGRLRDDDFQHTATGLLQRLRQREQRVRKEAPPRQRTRT